MQTKKAKLQIDGKYIVFLKKKCLFNIYKKISHIYIELLKLKMKRKLFEIAYFCKKIT